MAIAHNGCNRSRGTYQRAGTTVVTQFRRWTLQMCDEWLRMAPPFRLQLKDGHLVTTKGDTFEVGRLVGSLEGRWKVVEAVHLDGDPEVFRPRSEITFTGDASRADLTIACSKREGTCLHWWGTVIRSHQGIRFIVRGGKSNFGAPEEDQRLVEVFRQQPRARQVDDDLLLRGNHAIVRLRPKE